MHSWYLVPSFVSVLVVRVLSLESVLFSRQSVVSTKNMDIWFVVQAKEILYSHSGICTKG